MAGAVKPMRLSMIQRMDDCREDKGACAAGYDILDSILVALVEREPDRYGIAQRAIDWYDIGDVGLGRNE